MSIATGTEASSNSECVQLNSDGVEEGEVALLPFNQIPTDPTSSLDTNLAASPSAMVLLLGGGGAAESELTASNAPSVAPQGMLLNPSAYSSVASDLQAHNASISRHGGHSPHAHAHLITTSLLRSSAPEVVSHTAEARRVSTKPSERIGHRNANGKRNSGKGNRRESRTSTSSTTLQREDRIGDENDRQHEVGSREEEAPEAPMPQPQAAQEPHEKETIEPEAEEDEEDEEEEEEMEDDDDGEAEAMVVIQPLQQLVIDDDETPLPAPAPPLPAGPSSSAVNSDPQTDSDARLPMAGLEVDASAPPAAKVHPAGGSTPGPATTESPANSAGEVEVVDTKGPELEPTVETPEMKPPPEPKPPLELLVFGPHDAVAVIKSQDAMKEKEMTTSSTYVPVSVPILLHEPEYYQPWTPSSSTADDGEPKENTLPPEIEQGSPPAQEASNTEDAPAERRNDRYHDEGRLTLKEDPIAAFFSTPTTSYGSTFFGARTFGLGLGPDVDQQFWDTLGSAGAASERRRLRLMERREHIQHREADVRKTLVVAGESELDHLQTTLKKDLDQWFGYQDRVHALIQEEESHQTSLAQKLSDQLDRWNSQFRESLLAMWKSFQQQQLQAEEVTARLALVEAEIPLRDELFELELQLSTAILVQAQKLVTRRAKAKWKQMEFERKLRMGHVEQFAEIRKSWQDAPEAYGHRTLRLVEPPPDAPAPMIHQRGIYPSRLFRTSSPRGLNRGGAGSSRQLSFYARLAPLALSSSLPFIAVPETIAKGEENPKSPHRQRGASPPLPQLMGKDQKPAASASESWMQTTAAPLPLITGWRWERRSKSEAQLREEIRQELELQRRQACSHTFVAHRGKGNAKPHRK
jgi:hypothetical protein